ncbi:MAG: hypothetical protein NTW29_22535 [Bacteroidetes bacterium]|nr:hypothetical protein [Bacteroidota bacterium]
MTLFRKSIITGILVFALLVAGFFLLLRGCLAKYDERFIHVPALLFEKNGKTTVFSILEFQKTTSYSQNGGMTRKSVSTSYYVQTNDGDTGEELNKIKVKKHRQVKNFPVEMLGASGDNAWLFMGEPMAFDAYTLTKVADIAILEEKNPSLKGRFPAERQYYTFRSDDRSLYFTATDGTKWKLNTATLAASPTEYTPDENEADARIKALDEEIKNLRAYQDSVYQLKNRNASENYSSKKISYTEYSRLTGEFYAERGRIDKVRDSLYKLRSKLEISYRADKDRERAIENLQRSSISFSQIKQNQDTADGLWYGIYSPAEIANLNDRVSDNVAYDETIRRKFYTSSYSINKSDDAIIDKKGLKAVSTGDFLAAGLLLDKSTAMPVRLPGTAGYLIVHKDQVGREGKIQLTKIALDGRTLWTFNTGLTEWADWKLGSKKIFVFGVNNKSLSSSECNIMHSINLSDGKSVTFDYFKNKTIR